MSDYSLDVLEQDVRVLIEDVVKEQGFQDPHYHVTPGSKKGDNYLGVIHRIKVSDSKSGVDISIIVKCQPNSKIRREEFHSSAYFHQEARFYNTIIPSVYAFQRDIGLVESSPPTPKCYHAGDVLIVEDMCPYGYVMLDRQKPLDFAHCKLVLDSLAKYHAVSFAIRDQQPEELKRLTSSIEETFLVRDQAPKIQIMLDSSITKAVESFKVRYPDEKMTRYVEAIERYADGYYAQILGLIDGEMNEPYSVMCHGDSWINNILFKYDKDGKTPIELCFIDFQIVRYASPVIDISFFISCCTDKALRNEYYSVWMTSYYKSLSSYLKELGSDPEKLFPLSAFQDQLNRYSKFGVSVAAMMLPLFTCEPDEVIDLDAACEDKDTNSVKFNISHSNEAICYDRISDVLLDMVDMGYI